MVQGLEMYGVYKLIQRNRQLMRQLFVHFKPLAFTADMLFDMFPAKFSPEGSIARDAEEAALMNWVNYTQEIECKLAINSSAQMSIYSLCLQPSKLQQMFSNVKFTI